MEIIDYFYTFFAILASVGVFLIGCKMLSENMERLATGKIKNLFFKTSKSRLIGVGVGTATTSIIQSSALTTVMVVGLVNAGIMSLAQATTVIIGANIGTTVTAHIAALQSFELVKFAVGFAGIGAFMNLFSKNEKVKITGNSLAGLGLVFVGLGLMTSSMEIIKDSEKVINLFSSLTNPFALFAVGMVITAVIQSSSAITSIIISMAAAGITIGNGGNDVLFVILGTNVGTCVTALLSSIGTSTNARRASIIHLLFNVLGSLIFFILLLSWNSFMDDTFVKWFEHETIQIAMFHTFFNVTCAFIFVPLTNVLVKISTLIVHDKKVPLRSTYLDKRLLKTPGVALSATIKETMNMLDLTMDNLESVLIGFINRDEGAIDKTLSTNFIIETLSKEITDYLILISNNRPTLNDEKYISALHDSVSDIVRVSELADNITKYIDREIKENLIFSSTVHSQIKDVIELLKSSALLVKKVLLDHDYSVLSEIDYTEDAIDNMRKVMIKGHVDRLNKGECRAESSSVFINLANNLERAGDHLYYIAHSIELQ